MEKPIVAKAKLLKAAKALYSDYKENKELTIFTALDIEDTSGDVYLTTLESISDPEVTMNYIFEVE